MKSVRTIRLLAISLLILLLSACGNGRGGLGGGGSAEFDLSTLPSGTYGVEYDGRLQVQDYGGAVSLTQTGGELPPGLSLDEAGFVTGTPEYIGTFTFEALASGMQGVDDFTGDVSISISGDGVEGAFLGYEHDQLNNFDDIGGRMRDMWVRVSGTGLDQWSYTLNPGIYVAGPNGQNNRGRADDVRIGDLTSADLEWTLGEWEATNDPVLHEYEPDIFSQHIPEGDPPVIDPEAGVLTAGVDAGEQDIELSHPEYGTVQTRLMVTVPDWCPNGKHDGGWTDGICE